MQIRMIDGDSVHVPLSSKPFSHLSVAQDFARHQDEQGEDRPFFIMNAGQVVQQFQEWTAHLPRVQPFYAVKCNGDPLLLRLLASLGCGFDCASKGEIQAALSLPDLTPDRIVYANPCKTRSHVRHALATGVRRMTFDNAEELRKIRHIYPEAELILRIAVSDPSAICQLNNKFGCDPGQKAEELLVEAAEIGATVIGISFHVGSGCQDPSAFSEGIAHAKRLITFGSTLGLPMNLLDIGGGFPGFASNTITFPQIAREVNKGLDEHFPVGTPVEIIAEPGRFFAGAAFSLVCNIIAKTRVPAERVMEGGGSDKGAMYYLNDGVYGSFNCILYDHFSPTGVPVFKGGEKIASAVWGPTCDGLDCILPSVYLPEMEEGDWVIFHNMGAYTLAAGSEFNGFPRPSVLYCCKETLLGMIGKDEKEAEESGFESSGTELTSSSSCEDTDQESY